MCNCRVYTFFSVLGLKHCCISIIAVMACCSFTATAAPLVPSAPDTSRHMQNSAGIGGINSAQHALDSSQRQTGLLPDSTWRSAFLKHTYWSFGAGFRMGSQAFFDAWKKTMPTSSTELAGAGSGVGTFTIKQSVPGYSIMIPVVFGITPIINDLRSITFEGGFNYLGKTFIASLADKSDSATQWLHWTQSCRAYTVTLGVSYRHVIPEQYFSIEKSDKTWLLLGAGICPIMHITTSASLSSHNVADSTIVTARAYAGNHTYNGLGCTWKAGLATARSLSQRSGLEIDLAYTGGWYGNFRTGSSAAKWGSVNPASSSADKSLSFFSHAVEATFIFITAKKTPLSAQPVQGTSAPPPVQKK